MINLEIRENITRKFSDIINERQFDLIEGTPYNKHGFLEWGAVHEDDFRSSIFLDLIDTDENNYLLETVISADDEKENSYHTTVWENEFPSSEVLHQFVDEALEEMLRQSLQEVLQLSPEDMDAEYQTPFEKQEDSDFHASQEVQESNSEDTERDQENEGPDVVPPIAT